MKVIFDFTKLIIQVLIDFLLNFMTINYIYLNRFEEDVKNAIEKAVEAFGGIDILVNNAGAIDRTNTEKTTMKRYDLMNAINARGTFLCCKYALPYLKLSSNPHILNYSILLIYFIK